MAVGKRGIAVAGIGALALSMGITIPAGADEAYDVVASGLNNPRHLSIGTDGNLYVAESGTGGTILAGSNPENSEETVYFGRSGSVTRVNLSTGATTKVLTNLPSVAPEGGPGAIGPTDVEQQGTRFHVTIGLGADPAMRQANSQFALLGTFLDGMFVRGPQLKADLAAWEGLKDPDGDGPDSNPGGFAKQGSNYIVADAGGNSILRVLPNGKIETIAVLPSVPVPGFPPDFAMDPVPTSVVVGPDNAYYVSNLTGFPFPEGGANIWRVTPGQAPQKYASNLSGVTDLAWDGRDLYAVEIGLFSEVPNGALVQVVDNGTVLSNPVVVVDNLFAPYGVVVKDGTAYVTTGAVLPGGGQVIAVDLG